MGTAWGQRRDCMGTTGGLNGDRMGTASKQLENNILIVQRMNKKPIRDKWGLGQTCMGLSRE
eukprot:14128190-Alexandrium_andersonii.AAC.1